MQTCLGSIFIDTSGKSPNVNIPTDTLCKSPKVNSVKCKVVWEVSPWMYPVLKAFVLVIKRSLSKKCLLLELPKVP